tara:strand:- start:102419 stop:103390 length:972 start_codon:yes stop_codon:yes gene_type:complete
MNTQNRFITLAAAVLLLAACASAPVALDGVDDVRARLTMLRTDPDLANRAEVEIEAAETAVRAAEIPREDRALASHLLLIAGQKVEIANAWAQSRLYEDQRASLSERGNAAQLAARTREADMARSDAAVARTQATNAQNDADVSRRATERARDQAIAARDDASAAQSAADVAQDRAAMARSDANVARAETEELQRQIIDLNARMTDRGLVVTLGDVLFETGNAELRGGTPQNLDRLAVFLNQFETRTVQIEGHTDSIGNDSYNLVLSEQRADSVRDYLVRSGVVESRIVTTGLGEALPIASNDSVTGRQQNRRVEVIISDSNQ